jgi:broad specificity phosphatase PhoE
VPLTVIFVRHGESQANVDKVFANRPDFPGDLTGAGIAQAHDLARSLVPFGVTAIYTSPLARARQTAEIIAVEFGLTVTVADALREYDVGDFEGLPYTGDHDWRWDQYLSVQRAWIDGQLDASHPGGESLATMLGRFLPFMRTLPVRHTESDVIVAVGHGGLYHHVLPGLLPGISRQYAIEHGLGHGDMVIAAWTNGAWTCQRWRNESFPGNA